MVTIALAICIFGFIATIIYFTATLFTEQNTPDTNARLNRIMKPKNGQDDTTNSANSYLREQGDVNWSGQLILKAFPKAEEYLRQSGVPLRVGGFGTLTVGLLIAATIIHVLFIPFKSFAILTGIGMACLPYFYVSFMRKKRLAKYSEYLPDALSMMCNALKAGQSLNACFSLVSEQAPAPLGPEFARCYEEQNLGIPLETALLEMSKRAPNVDLKFFAMAVILQRQTGGDLCEILDKIARLIRERFQIHGMIMALTGEGRLSGAVLLGLPPVLTGVMFFLNPEYIMRLFTHPTGHQMLAGAAVAQVLGFFWIRKIIDIKV
ncbi:MAG: type II secretion system F family protein [Planctomycetaceae bacterium]|jgi:tight adherence protein B|nr:type II secretion system F family protein [Planctomycetaceae bacterium]